MRYWEVLDGYLKESSLADVSKARLVTVPGSEESIAILDQIQGYRDRQIVLRGNRLFRDVIVLILDSDPDSGVAEIQYCHDVKGISAFSSITGEKLEISSIGTVVENAQLEQGPDGIWRISQIQNEDAKC